MSSIRYKTEENCNDHEEWREQPLHPPSIVDLTSFLQILLLKGICSFFVIILFYIEVMPHCFAHVFPGCGCTVDSWC